MTTGYRRAEFLTQVEQESEDPPHSSMADHKWQDDVGKLQRAAANQYVNGPLKEQLEGYKELIQERETTLHDRRRARARLAKLGTCSEDHPGGLRAAERESRTDSHGNSRNSHVWHTARTEGGTKRGKQHSRRSSWRRRGRPGSPLSTSCPGSCLAKLDQKGGNTAP